MSELFFFDPREEFTIIERRLPHWSQADVICFLTWRTHDSIPHDVLESWRQERRQCLRSRGINPRAPDWKARVERLPRADRLEFFRQFSSRWHAELDAGYGRCVLRNSDLAGIVADSLHHFDADRYELTDFVIMPNHVHLLVAFPTEAAMLKQCDSWKHYTACEINARLGTTGRFWQTDGFDHLVRSQEQFDHFRTNIADNPRKAGLPTGSYLHYRSNDQA